MADEPDTNTATPEPTTAPQAPATPAPPTVTLTVEEFEAKLNERAAQVRRAEQAKVKPQPEPPKPKKGDEPQPQGLSPDEVQTMMRRQSAFDRAIGKAGLADEQVSILETLFGIEKPEDVADWVSRKSKAFGKAQAAAPAPSPAQPHATPAAPHAPAAPAPSTSVPSDGPDQVRKWDEHQIRAYLGRTPGANASNLMHWSNRKASIEIAERLAGELAGYRIASTKK